ncbi:hypothetical protein BJY01DRAFT_254424 [Aspergillus pseudoustus]|uniref:Uncharacterized protein n=1 Tax=Aspergillus pseudoustus TaxID=1810923 RepID=A0ABR4IT98_9EURO
MDIAFPVLEQVPFISISGRASTVSLPQLSSLAPTESNPSLVPDWPSFEQDGAPISLDLPKLQVVFGSITFSGNFSALSLPRLRSVWDNFWVEAGAGLSIGVPLESAGDLSFTGNIER